MKYKVSVIKLVTLVMAMVLAVALVACQGAVGAKGEPGETPPPQPPTNVKPTVKAEILDQTLVGMVTATVDLSDHFDDPDSNDLPTFAASAEKPEVVTASVSGHMLSLVAGMVGETTVTVTATDAGGLMVSDAFMVSVVEVAAPEPDPDSEFRFVFDVGDKELITLEEGQFVTSSKEYIVSVLKKPDNQWELAALSKGEIDLVVYSEDGQKVTTDKVKVNNRPPKRKADTAPNAVYDMSPDNAPTKVATRHMLSRVYVVPVGLKGLYEDPDGEDDLKFSARSVNTGVALVVGIDKGGESIYINVVDGGPEYFTIIVEVMDSDKESAPVVRLKVRNSDPLVQEYSVHQRDETGTFGTVRTTYRKLADGYEDTLKFENTADTDAAILTDSAFVFTEKIELPDNTDNIDAAEANTTPPTVAERGSISGADVAEDWYTVGQKGSPIHLGALETSAASGEATMHTATLKFRTKTKNDRTTVTLTYNVAVSDTASEDKKVAKPLTISVTPAVEEAVVVE